MSRIELIGVSGTALAAEQWPLLRRCTAIVASRRHRLLVADLPHPVIDIAPVEAMLSQVETALAEGDVAVLASGDPLFYGIGRSLIGRFGPERLTVRPALSALQLACARFRIPWDDLALLSCHGRVADNLPGRILRYPRSMLFTDGRNSPDWVAAELLAVLAACEDSGRIGAIRIRVAENLGLGDERLTSGSLAEIAARSFGPLNMMLIEQPPCPLPPFGLVEAEIVHSRGLITKDEVRAATLHRLRLPATGVLWDIGGGSGSISLEASRLCPDLAIRVVEKKEEEQANIRANIRRFGAYSIRLVGGEAPEALAGLPAPDRVFIGGSGQRLEAIVEAAAVRLADGGRMVINAVLERTETAALACLERLGMRVSASTLAVSRRLPGGEVRAFNPITLITGEKR
ncbi:MAG: precorrin-6y C5,15-methyltransferase (decarboxylating) subunit CbiE [Desulfobulbus sp.]|jgi:precorrin-6Y C5,15-methyltransferase (decarboxylating)|uniref:precorrin-6y C5,15-methyltransferase (decarboxylating) subunit CbiE n=1 Tax=Desulfobulbus sp. TaxID=895 RepID=UPI00283BDE2F|nr:precorrin-6y C5,15-methyltransferase (decarboxylating) subunit CbiE [Desulfobulbus sp.]MDR2549717.1 precorrin-6y C5,15-methyltransferase (decarboxylating) subunit CbiE [Desulfobulbus sp.]